MDKGDLEEGVNKDGRRIEQVVMKEGVDRDGQGCLEMGVSRVRHMGNIKCVGGGVGRCVRCRRTKSISSFNLKVFSRILRVEVRNNGSRGCVVINVPSKNSFTEI